MDLFYNIGASRGKDIVPQFIAAFAENADYAVRIALWARDIRGGSGERKLFRDILKYLSKTDTDLAIRVAQKVPELGRWDDLFALEGEARQFAFNMIGDALGKDDGLCAKWMPRQGSLAVELREWFGMTPKQWRKTLVNLTNVVETKMCNKDWEGINFSHVPSLASSRYKKAFAKHSQAFKDYVAALTKGDKTVKVNAAAVYPYDILKNMRQLQYASETEKNHVIAQWNALPNFVGDAAILPMVDVSGSMTCPAGGYGSKSAVTCLDVAISLGLYLADKNKGKFNGTFLTFSGSPELMNLQGNILQKYATMHNSNWGMNTNLHAAFDKVLEVAVENGVAQEEMPKYILILSDMQFDACVRFDDTAHQMIKRKYEKAGYEVPNVVFWNLNAAYGNTPVSFKTNGTALVSGFSPSLVKSVLKADLQKFTPESVMLETIMSDRYAY